LQRTPAGSPCPTRARPQPGVGADPEIADRLVLAWVVANALTGFHRAIVDDVRRQVLAGVDPGTIAEQVRVRGQPALAALAHGIDAVTI
jgi:hypothetical protein